MDNFDLRKFLIENRLTTNSLNEAQNSLEEQVRRYAELSEQIKQLTVELTELKKSYSEIEEELLPELQRTQDNMISVDNIVDRIIVKIERKAYDRTSAAYKDAFDWLFSRVNQAMQNIVQEAVDATKKTTTIAPKVGVYRRDKSAGELEEGGFSDTLSNMWSNIKRNVKSFVVKIKRPFRRFNNTLEDAINNVPKDL